MTYLIQISFCRALFLESSGLLRNKGAVVQHLLNARRRRAHENVKLILHETLKSVLADFLTHGGK